MAALFLTGWPMLLYGFDWSSYNNSDMSHYCLGASRLLDFGFFDEASLATIREGKDYSFHNAYMYIRSDGRSGERTYAGCGVGSHWSECPSDFHANGHRVARRSCFRSGWNAIGN